MKDLKGQDLAVGDTIVYAFAMGTSPYLRIGIIREFIVKKGSYGNKWTEKMKVEWQDTERVWDQNTQTHSTQPKIWTSLVEFSSRALKI